MLILQYGKITLGALQETREELCEDLIGARATSVEERIKAQETDVYRKEKDGVGKQTDGVFGNVSVQALIRLPLPSAMSTRSSLSSLTLLSPKVRRPHPGPPERHPGNSVDAKPCARSCANSPIFIQYFHRSSVSFLTVKNGDNNFSVANV